MASHKGNSHKGNFALNVDASSIHKIPATREERLATLRRFVSALQLKVENIAKQDLSQKQLAREALSILRSIIREESDQTLQHDVIRNLFEKLCNSISIQSLFQDLYNRCSVVLAGTNGSQIALKRTEVVNELDQILAWYETRRSRIYELLGIQNSKPDIIFGYHVLQDRLENETQGIEIRAAVRLSHKTAQTIWLKASFSYLGQPVLTKVGWETWIDKTDTFIRMVPGLSKYSATHSLEPLSILLPLLPSHDQLIIDNATLFVPYAAIDVPAGQRELLVELCLLDNQGRKLDQISDQLNLLIPAEISTNSWPSQQSLALWKHNPISNDAVTTLSAKQTYSSLGKAVIAISYDIHYFSHNDSQLELSIELLTPDAEPIAASHENYADLYGNFKITQKLTARQIINYLHDQNILVPLDALSLADGFHRLLCKIQVASAKGEIICGHITSLQIEMLFDGSTELPFTLLPQLRSAKDLDLGLSIEKFGLEPNSQLGDHPSSRSWVCLSNKEALDNPCRVVMSVEQESQLASSDLQRMRPLRQEFYARSLQTANSRQYFVANFYWHEIAAALPRIVKSSRLIFRVQVYCPSERLLFNRTRITSLPLDQLFNTPKHEYFRDTPVYISDLKFKPSGRGLGVQALLTLAISTEKFPSKRISIYHEIVNQQGVTVISATSKKGLSGMLHFELDQQLGLQAKVSGYQQVEVQVEAMLSNNELSDLAPGCLACKIVVFGDNGEALQTVKLPFNLRRFKQAANKLFIDCHYNTGSVKTVERSAASQFSDFFAKLKHKLHI